MSDPQHPQTDPLAAIETTAAQLLTLYRASADPHVRFVLGELGPARYAFARSMAEMQERPPLGHLMFMRLVAEVGVRLAWIARRIEQDGEEGVRTSIDAVLKRDLMHLRAANVALRQGTAYVDEEIAKIAAAAAPPTLPGLAAEAPVAANAYAMHRFASALIHPGVGLRNLLRAVPDMQIGLRDSMVSCVVLAADLLAEIGHGVQPVDPEELLREPLFGYSPTAVAHRLRRELRKRFGAAAPTISNSSMSLVFKEETGTSITLEVELVREDRKWTVSGTGENPGEAFRNLATAAVGSGDA